MLAPGRPTVVFGRVAVPEPRPSSRIGRPANRSREEDVRAAAYFQRLMHGPLGGPPEADASDEPPVEQVGRWRVQRIAGSGGMSTVYEVAPVFGSASARAALKLASFSPSGRPAQQLIHEYRVLRELQHPAVVRGLDAGLHSDGRPYLVLDFLDGVPLTTYAWDRPVRERLVVFQAVCEAVSVLHGAGFVHCDLKPGNILVSATGRVTLIDFGIARRTGETVPAMSGLESVLTPEFASPEQMMGTQISTASDVYTLGLLLHEMLCGRRRRLPWGLSGGSDLSLSFCPTRFVPGEWGTQQVASGVRPSDSPSYAGRAPQLGGVSLDSQIERVVRNALQPDPYARYPSAVELSAAVAKVRIDLDYLLLDPTMPFRRYTPIPELCESS